MQVTAFAVAKKRTKRILALVRAIKSRNGKPVFIVGFSRGSVDVGQFSKTFPNQINEIIIASGIYTDNS